MMALLTWLGSFLSGPVINGAIKAYQAKLAAGNTSEKIGADLAVRELAVQQRELELQTQLRIAQIGRWYEPEHVMGYTVAAYFAKLLVWDMMLGLGSTDPMKGFALDTANLIVIFYFGKRGIENVARILKK